MHWIVEPGFFSSQPVHTALIIGGVVAVVTGVVGVFTVVRGQSFGGHALTDVSTMGGTAAFLAGLSPLPGFIGAGVVGAGAMDLIGVNRVRGRDLATGIVLGAATGLAALFLYLGTTERATTGATQQILFGSIFLISSSTVPVVVVLGAIAVALLASIHRPLQLASVNPDLAAARGVPVRSVGVEFMLCLALAVGLSSVAIGSILSTALLVGPAATALRLARRPATAVVTACAVGLAATWLGVLLSYDSYAWGSTHTDWPVSFFVVAAVVAMYLLSGLRRPARRRPARPRD
jgi:zinc/manganese transport system permease protein